MIVLQTLQQQYSGYVIVLAAHWQWRGFYAALGFQIQGMSYIGGGIKLINMQYTSDELSPKRS